MINTDNLIGHISTVGSLVGSICAKGDNAYLHIKYSSNMPTQDSDMKDTPDDFIGICSTNTFNAPVNFSSYTWFKWKGSPGPMGVITSIEKIATAGLVDTYQINCSDGSHFTFNVTNGSGIETITLNGVTIPVSNKSVNIDALAKGQYTSFDNITVNCFGKVIENGVSYWFINFISGNEGFQKRWLCNSTDTTEWRREKVNGTWSSWIPVQAL